MSTKPCNCGDAYGHAKAVESAIFMSLSNAGADPSREDHWRAHADKLEGKFTTAHGRHYGAFLYPEVESGSLA